MATSVNVRKLTGETLLQYDKLRRKQKATWDDIDWEEVELISGSGHPNHKNVINVVNTRPAFRELYEAQKTAVELMSERKVSTSGYCDIRFVVDDGCIPVHGVFLGLAEKSKFFREIYNDFIKMPSREDVIILILDGIKLQHLRIVLSLLYTGRTVYSVEEEEDVQSLMKMLDLHKFNVTRDPVKNDFKGKKKKKTKGLIAGLRSEESEQLKVFDCDINSGETPASIPVGTPIASTSRQNNLVPGLHTLDFEAKVQPSASTSASVSLPVSSSQPSTSKKTNEILDSIPLIQKVTPKNVAKKLQSERIRRSVTDERKATKSDLTEVVTKRLPTKTRQKRQYPEEDAKADDVVENHENEEGKSESDSNSGHSHKNKKKKGENSARDTRLKSKQKANKTTRSSSKKLSQNGDNIKKTEERESYQTRSSSSSSTAVLDVCHVAPSKRRKLSKSEVEVEEEASSDDLFIQVRRKKGKGKRKIEVNAKTGHSFSNDMTKSPSSCVNSKASINSSPVEKLDGSDDSVEHNETYIPPRRAKTRASSKILLRERKRRSLRSDVKKALAMQTPKGSDDQQEKNGDASFSDAISPSTSDVNKPKVKPRRGKPGGKKENNHKDEYTDQEEDQGDYLSSMSDDLFVPLKKVKAGSSKSTSQSKTKREVPSNAKQTSRSPKKSKFKAVSNQKTPDPVHSVDFVCGFCGENQDSLEDLDEHLQNSCAVDLQGMYQLKKKFCKTCGTYLNSLSYADFTVHLKECVQSAKLTRQRRKQKAESVSPQYSETSSGFETNVTPSASHEGEVVSHRIMNELTQPLIRVNKLSDENIARLIDLTQRRRRVTAAERTPLRTSSRKKDLKTSADTGNKFDPKFVSTPGPVSVEGQSLAPAEGVKKNGRHIAGASKKRAASSNGVASKKRKIEEIEVTPEENVLSVPSHPSSTVEEVDDSGDSEVPKQRSPSPQASVKAKKARIEKSSEIPAKITIKSEPMDAKESEDEDLTFKKSEENLKQKLKKTFERFREGQPKKSAAEEIAEKDSNADQSIQVKERRNESNCDSVERHLNADMTDLSPRFPEMESCSVSVDANSSVNNRERMEESDLVPRKERSGSHEMEVEIMPNISNRSVSTTDASFDADDESQIEDMDNQDQQQKPSQQNVQTLSLIKREPVERAWGEDGQSIPTSIAGSQQGHTKYNSNKVIPPSSKEKVDEDSKPIPRPKANVSCSPVSKVRLSDNATSSCKISLPVSVTMNPLAQAKASVVSKVPILTVKDLGDLVQEEMRHQDLSVIPRQNEVENQEDGDEEKQEGEQTEVKRPENLEQNQFQVEHRRVEIVDQGTIVEERREAVEDQEKEGSQEDQQMLQEIGLHLEEVLQRQDEIVFQSEQQVLHSDEIQVGHEEVINNSSPTHPPQPDTLEASPPPSIPNI